ncbi:MAG TPA: DUF1003 domain-containing protein [Gemmatimonadaceae bacterium]
MLYRAWFSPSFPAITLQGAVDTSQQQVQPKQLERRRNRVIANRAFGAIKAQHAAERTIIEALADFLNDAASSSPFLLFHVAWFLVWIPWNLGLLPFAPFDPYPFGLLTMIVSLEAIFLSIFVLMAQKRESAIAELREELMLQLSLRTEEEVTKTLQLVSGLYTRLGHVTAEDEELGDMLRPLDIDSIEREVTEQIAQVAANRRRSSPLRRKPRKPGSLTG